ncbi:hypothetical protein CEXT_774551 [Caerostris extrusa]|uniref:Uncharacterized protein n=1 Tax=Caerostris extrusa TaxID=172846 RepID=A0AAV4UBY0_CAEEX|nr:hypothetical protein CEXT_774551 [Caerostris extrusa]
MHIWCPLCDEDTLHFDMGAKLGFDYDINIVCNACSKFKAIASTSEKDIHLNYDVNLRMTKLLRTFAKDTMLLKSSS